MADDPAPDSDSDSDSGSDPGSIDVEFERAYDRGDLATVFRAFASALEDGAPVRIDGEDASATLAVPPRVVAEFEAERDPDDEPPVAELDIELEWDDPDGSSVRLASDADDDAIALAGEGRTAGESATESAMATMPPEGVPGTDGDADDASESDRTTAREADEPAAGDRAQVRDRDEDQGRSSGRTSRFEVYQDRADEWRWRLVHWNGNIIADSGEGYTSRSNAKRAVRSVMRAAPTARIVNRDADDSNAD